MRSEFFYLAFQIPGQQIVGLNAKDLGKDKKLQIRNAPLLIFQSGHSVSAHVPAS